MSQSSRNHFFAVWLIAAFAFLAVVGAAMIHFAPTFVSAERIVVKSSTTPVVLGYPELGQKTGYFSAAQQHLSVRYSDKAKTWLIANVAPKKKVLATLSDGTQSFLRVWYLNVGDTIRMDNTKAVVQALNPLELEITEGNGKSKIVVWKKGALIDGSTENFAACATPWWKSLVRAEKSFALGGKVACDTRLKLADIPLRSAIIANSEHSYYLRPMRSDVHITVQAAKSKRAYQVGEIEHRADNISTLIMGRTLYRVSQTTGANASFSLKPLANFHVFAEQPEATSNSLVTTQWSQEPQWLGALGADLKMPSLKAWIILLGLLGITFISSMFIAAARNNALGERKRWLPFMLSLPCVLLLWAGVLWLGNATYQVAFVWLSWAWLTVVMAQQRILTWELSRLWLFSVLIAGIGLLTQLQLAGGSESTRWLQYPGRHIQFMLLVPVILMPLVLMPTAMLQMMWRFLTTSKIAKFVVLGLIALALFVQFVAGDEKGIFGFQPVELTKTVLVFMFAGFAVNWFHLRQVNALSARGNMGKQLAFFGWVILLALLVYIVVLGGVRDFSPILITAGLLLAFIWTVVKLPHLPVSRATWIVRLSIIAVLLMVLGLGLFIISDPSRAQLLAWLPQSDRIALWAAPWNYPDTGRQLQLALEAVHGGSKEVATYNWFGVQWFGLNGGRLLSIPAIQDDFILAFYLHKWGGFAGLILLLLQSAWVLGMFGLSKQLLLDAEKRNRDQRLSYRFLAYVVYGMAWMHVLHWLISWGNTLGILPIMGQPMTWLSAGMSHLLAVALPSLVLMVLAARFNR